MAGRRSEARNEECLMDFAPSPDQLAIRDAVRDFARKEIAPGYL